MERAEGGEGKSADRDGGKTSFEIFTLCHSYSLMDSVGTTSLWPYHPPCPFLPSSIAAIFFKEPSRVLNCVFDRLILTLVVPRYSLLKLGIF